MNLAVNSWDVVVGTPKSVQLFGNRGTRHHLEFFERQRHLKNQPTAIESGRYAASSPPCTGGVQKPLVGAQIAMFIGEVVHAMTDAFGKRTRGLAGWQVEVERRDDIAENRRFEAATLEYTARLRSAAGR